MSENSDALKRGYDAFNSGDVDTVAKIFAAKTKSGNEVKLRGVVWRMSNGIANRVQTLIETADLNRALGG